MGGTSAFADGPDNQALAAAHVTGGEDAGDAAHVVVVDLDISPVVFLQPELVDRAGMLGVEEAHRQQAQVAVSSNSVPGTSFIW